MGKRVTFTCDECHKEKESNPIGILPYGWLECSFYDAQKWRGYCFYSYACIIIWSERIDRHY